MHPGRVSAGDGDAVQYSWIGRRAGAGDDVIRITVRQVATAVEIAAQYREVASEVALADRLGSADAFETTVDRHARFQPKRFRARIRRVSSDGRVVRPLRDPDFIAAGRRIDGVLQCRERRPPARAGGRIAAACFDIPRPPCGFGPPWCEETAAEQQHGY